MVVVKHTNTCLQLFENVGLFWQQIFLVNKCVKDSIFSSANLYIPIPIPKPIVYPNFWDQKTDGF